jgi:arsenate reductase
MKKRVLFLCTGNSARSQMAEALLRKIAGGRYDAYSAGTHPKGLHPLTVQAMNDVGIDVSGRKSKDVQTFAGQQFDYVITVCDRAKEECPIFPGARPIHWGFEDPAAAEGPAEKQIRTFQSVLGEIERRLKLFVAADKDF